MKRIFLLATAIAALSAGAAHAQPGHAGIVARERGGIAAQEAKAFQFAFGQPYYDRPSYHQPYHAPAPDQDPYQYCHLGVCY
jgi:hypothetical protein